MKRNLYTIILFVLFVFYSNVLPQELTKEYKTEVVNKISTMLSERYVFPDTALKCGNHIKNKLDSGAFDSITTKESFAVILTKELQSISRDKHMRVRTGQPQTREVAEDPFLREFQIKLQNQGENLGFAKVEYLEGGIGYLDLRFFAPLALTKKYAESAMNLLSASDALIIDLRKNRGGSPDLIQYICSYFFNERTHLNSLYYREGNRTEEFWTYDVGNKSLNDVPVFVLTSGFTFSGGEEFTNNLKTRKRGVIIGETTGGGANPGGIFRIDDNLNIFIPTGKAINPVTNSNWEGIGVEPDIKTSSDEAYDIALQKATLAAVEYRTKKLELAQKSVKELSSKLKEAEALLKTDKPRAEKLIKNALDKGIADGLADENAINNAGYEYLFNNKIDLAIAVFRYNVARYPESFNVYDSLAEAYMKNNQNDLSINNYKKSLELNPDNKNAEEMIKKMTN